LIAKEDEEDYRAAKVEIDALALEIVKIALRDSAGPMIALYALSMAQGALVRISAKMLKDNGAELEEILDCVRDAQREENVDELLLECESRGLRQTIGSGSIINPVRKA
jgi:hypothetical protein